MDMKSTGACIINKKSKKKHLPIHGVVDTGVHSNPKKIERKTTLYTILF